MRLGEFLEMRLLVMRYCYICTLCIVYDAYDDVIHSLMLI